MSKSPTGIHRFRVHVAHGNSSLCLRAWSMQAIEEKCAHMNGNVGKNSTNGDLNKNI